jgi:hypothetical protein
MEVLIDNKNGTVWDMPVSMIKWGTSRIGKVGTLESELVIENPLEAPINNGDVIRVTDGENKVFYGYVFETEYQKHGKVSVTAYDQLRYLMSNDTFVFAPTTASAAIKKIASDFQLKTGIFEDTGYIMPPLVEDDKKALDVAYKCLDSTLIATNRNFVLFDDFGSLELRNIENMSIKADDFFIGEESLLFDFNYKKSIDDETYNRVKLVQDNKDTGKREVYIAQDSANIAKFGRLQYFQKVDEKMTSAQIKDLLDRLIRLRNRETKSLKLDCLGNWKVRAGSFVLIYIEKLGIKEYFLVDECTHEWKEGIHTMQLDLKVI